MAKLGDLSVGSIVKLNVDGVATNFIVVHQGLPSSDYDSSCNGTWLLMQDLTSYTTQWGDYDSGTDVDSSDIYNSYGDSKIHTYLNDTFLNSIDNSLSEFIKQAKIPYRKGYGNIKTVSTGADGLPAKIFLLSEQEVGKNVDSYSVTIGSVLEYFNGAENSKRIAYSNGTAKRWWLRSPVVYGSGSGYKTYVRYVNVSGGVNRTYSYSRNLRPTLIMDPAVSVDDSGFIVASSPAILGNTTIGGISKELTGESYVNIGGVRKPVTESYTCIGGVWKPNNG